DLAPAHRRPPGLRLHRPGRRLVGHHRRHAPHLRPAPRRLPPLSTPVRPILHARRHPLVDRAGRAGGLDPMSHLFAYLARMKFIRRWGLMHNTYPENIQEHSARVAMIAHALAVVRNRLFAGRVDPARAALLGLFHDASEVLTGDLPTPVKYFNPQIR